MKPIDVAQGLYLPRKAVALVLAGGRGSRLKNLTDTRAKPAVYFGGKFRIVDFALSMLGAKRIDRAQLRAQQLHAVGQHRFQQTRLPLRRDPQHNTPQSRNTLICRNFYQARRTATSFFRGN